MSQQLSDLIVKACRENIERLEEKILGGGIATLEEYKRLTGERRGRIAARDEAIEAVNIEDDEG